MISQFITTSNMGLCTLLGRQLLQNSIKTYLKKRPQHHVEWLEPIPREEAFRETEILILDMTQLFYISNNRKAFAVGEEKVYKYKSLDDMICKQTFDLIGEIDVDNETGTVTNRVQTFSMEEMVCVVGNKVFDHIERWKSAATEYGMQDVLKFVFLCMDGDAATAKSSAHRKRSRFSFSEMLQRKLLLNSAGTTVPQNSMYERTRTQEIEPGRLYKGSMARFMGKRKNQILILKELATLLKDSRNPVTHETSIYLVAGPASGWTSRERCRKMCGKLNHPHFRSLKLQEVRYAEADSIIPMVWSFMKQSNMKACVISKDTDMLVTLLSLADPNLLLMCHMGQEFCNKILRLFDREIAFRVKPAVAQQKNKQLEILLHLTMGGNDYVESFPRVGAETLLHGCDVMRGYPKTQFFPCVSFVTWLQIEALLDELNYRSDDYTECVRFHVRDLQEPSVFGRLMHHVVETYDNIFPIRLQEHVYLIEYDPTRTDENFEWYAKRCPANRFKKATNSQAKLMCQPGLRAAFRESMKRRLYSLSLLSDSRPQHVSWVTLPNEELAKKCGYSAVSNYVYMNRMKIEK